MGVFYRPEGIVIVNSFCGAGAECGSSASMPVSHLIWAL